MPDADAMADEVEAPGWRRLGPLMAAAAAAAARLRCERRVRLCEQGLRNITTLA